MATRINFNFTLPVNEKNRAPQSGRIFGDLEKDTRYTFSGKSAIALALKYFKANGRLGNKADELLVPEWMGTWIYMTIHRACFPTTAFNPKVKGVFVYHQWGFPQKMDEILKFCKTNGLFCIEDCAHAFESYYHGQRVGTFGDAAIFSLSKFFPSVLGGAVYSKDQTFLKLVDDSFTSDDPALAKEVFEQRARYDADPDNQKNMIDVDRNYATYDKLFACPEYSLNAVKTQLKEGAMEKRAANVDLFKEAFGTSDHWEDLFAEKVYPWAIPLFFSKKANRKIADELKKNNIESEVYHFDVNRNMLAPDFQECVAVPCHQGLSTSEISRIIGLIQKQISV